MKFDLPKENSSIIKVLGVGGGGSNAVNHMYQQGIKGVDFLVCNTDQQALDVSPVPLKVQLGATLTEGRGAGSLPEVGKNAATENIDDLKGIISKNTKMVFITAGMGGGTGTGAAPVIAQTAREMGVLTVGIVTMPFFFEGRKRRQQAEAGIEEIRQQVDTLLIINNEKLREMCGNLPIAQAFAMADDVLHAGVRGVTDLMVMPGLINLDFADIRTVMSEMGKAMMGTGEGEGDNRAIEAAEAAISNPLLDDISMKGAKGVLINITGGQDMTLFEVDEAANRIREEVDPDANIIFGSTFSDDLDNKMRVSVVATGIDAALSELGSVNSTTSQRVTFAKAKEANDVLAQETAEEESKKNSPNTKRFSPPSGKPIAAESETEGEATIASFPAEKVVTAREQFQRKARPKKPSFFEKAARTFGFIEDEEDDVAANSAPAGRTSSSAEKVKLENSDEDYYEIPAYMRRKQAKK